MSKRLLPPPLTSSLTSSLTERARFIPFESPLVLLAAATNLSFIYFHEADYQNAIKYADLAMKHNRYNAKALVNKGNCMFMRGDLEHARSMYQEAMGAEADCLEAICA